MNLIIMKRKKDKVGEWEEVTQEDRLKVLLEKGTIVISQNKGNLSISSPYCLLKIIPTSASACEIEVLEN